MAGLALRLTSNTWGRGMSDPSGSDPPGTADQPCEVAKRIAAQIAPMVRLAKERGFDFLAYLLGMALKESRRLSEGKEEG